MEQAPAPLEFLFATWEGGGNIPPVLTAIRRLLARGHRVRMMSDACTRRDAEASGAEFIRYTRAPSRPDKLAMSDLMRDWEAVSPQDGFGRMRDQIMCGPALGYAQDVIAELARRPADLLVSSEMLFGVMAAAEARGQRLALLASNISLYPIPGIPPFGPGFLPARDEAERTRDAAVSDASRQILNAGLPSLNAARQVLGLAPVADVLDQLAAADRLLLATSRAFDFPATELPASIRYVGPLLDDPPWAEPWRSPWPAGDGVPLLLVAFSTTFQGHGELVQRVIDAIAELPVRAVVTLGPALDDGDLRAAPNVAVCRSAPHDAVMRDARAVVTHAGHGTVMRALSHRLPLLCFPLGRDQLDNAARLTARGAGLSLPPDAAAEDIRRSLRELLGSPAVREAARRLGDTVASEAKASPLVQELEGLATARPRAGRPLAVA